MAGYLPVPYTGGTPVPYTPLAGGTIPPTLTEQLAGGMSGSAGPFAGMGAPAAAAPEAAVASAAPNFVGKALIRAGIPEQFIGPMYAPGMWGGVAAGILSHPVGGLVGQLTGNQSVGNATEGALRYGGTGASLGSLVGPEGTAVGALLGAGYGIYSGLNKKTAPPLDQQAFKMLSGFGVDSQVQGQIRQTYNQLQGSDKATADQWLSGVVQQAGQAFQTQANPFAQQQTAEQNLQLQQLAGQAMSPYVTDMRSNLDATAKQLTDNMGHNLSPSQSAALKPLVAQYTNLSKNVGDAYALQAESFPIMNQLAKSGWANMIQQATGGGSGGLTSLLAQQATVQPQTTPTLTGH